MAGQACDRGLTHGLVSQITPLIFVERDERDC
jgi:hypothetical protein